MIYVIAKWLITALAFLAAAYLIPGISVSGFGIAMILALFWGIINISIRPILILLTLPITLLTFGLFTIVINGLLFWFLGSFIKGFEVDGFIAGLMGALVLSGVSWLGNKFIHATKTQHIQ